jgi:hypothetical protein
MSDGAAGRRTRARRSGSDAGCLEPVEKIVTHSERRLLGGHVEGPRTGLTAAERWLAASLEPAPGTEGEPTHG